MTDVQRKQAATIIWPKSVRLSGTDSQATTYYHGDLLFKLCLISLLVGTNLGLVLAIMLGRWP